MIKINLTSPERDVLIRTLDEYISELHMEIRDTEKWDYKDKLKEEQTILNRLLGELRTDQAMEQEKGQTAKP